MKTKRSFASDNNAGVHPRVMEALQAVNAGHVIAYGDDSFTRAAVEKIREHFGERAEVHFVFGGTGANVLGLKAVTNPFHAIICSQLAHINVDECGAPENFTGCKLIPLPTADGKITLDQIAPRLHGLRDQHHSQPRVISISQTTELGTVYTVEEIKRLSEFAHERGLLLHMDGARLANAAAALNLPLRAFTTDAGVDVLSFGGTKNGMMYGEAVVFFNPELSADFRFIRKQGMQLSSKMRFIAAQFGALLTDNLWLESAAHANRMARILAQELERIPQIKVTQKVEANAVFAIIPREYVPRIQQEYFFYVWNEETSEVRLMASFDTTEQDIQDFIATIRNIIQ